MNALHYLLKPVAPERLAVTVSRLAAAHPPAPRADSLTYEDRLLLRLGQERAFVRVRDIVAIEAEGDGSTLLLAPHLTRSRRRNRSASGSNAFPHGTPCASAAPPS